MLNSENCSCYISPRISDQSSANDNTQRLATTETTERHGNFNLFHFQNDQMWPVNMSGKMKGWPVNSQISSDIVCWPAVISSPELWTWHNQTHEKLYKFYKMPQNLQSLWRFLFTLPFLTPERFLPPYETVHVFCETCNHYATSKSDWINLWFNSLPGVFRNTTNLNFKKIFAKSSLFNNCH